MYFRSSTLKILQYCDFIVIFWYPCCRFCNAYWILHSVVYTYIVPSPKHQLYQLQWHSPRHKNKPSLDQNHAHPQGEIIWGKKATFPNAFMRLPTQVTFIDHFLSLREWLGATILDDEVWKGIAEKFLFELPHMLITWYCVVQSHMYTKYNIRVGHLEVVMSQQEKR